MKTITQQYRKLISFSDQMLVRFDKDHLKEISSKQNTNARLEIIDKHKLGYALSTKENDPTLQKRALNSALFGDIVSYTYPKTKNFSKIPLHSEKITKLTPSRFIELGNDIIQSLKSINNDILVSVYMAKITGKRTLQTSAGIIKKEEETALSIDAYGELVREGDILGIDNYFYWRDEIFDKELFIENLKEKFQLAQTIVDFPSGTYPVLFTPRGFSTLLDFLETALSAETVFRKISKWTDSLSKEVIDPRFSLIDDPTIAFAPSSTEFDDEGFETKPLPLIEKGVLKNFYTDLKYSEKLQIKPNARGFGIPASPQLTNLIVSPGEIDSEKIISHIEKGIVIDQVIGAGQDSPYSGDFSLNIHLGFAVENGKMKGRVKNALVTGNIFDMLQHTLAEISSDREWIGSKKLPYISFRDVRIVGKE